jgi:hypothetical protein
MKYYKEQEKRGVFYKQQKEEKLAGLVTSCLGAAFMYVIGRKIEGMIEMTGRRGRRRKQLLDDRRNTEGPGNRKRKQYIAVCGVLYLEQIAIFKI